MDAKLNQLLPDDGTECDIPESGLLMDSIEAHTVQVSFRYTELRCHTSNLTIAYL